MTYGQKLIISSSSCNLQPEQCYKLSKINVHTRSTFYIKEKRGTEIFIFFHHNFLFTKTEEEIGVQIGFLDEPQGFQHTAVVHILTCNLIRRESEKLWISLCIFISDPCEYLWKWAKIHTLQKMGEHRPLHEEERHFRFDTR